MGDAKEQAVQPVAENPEQFTSLLEKEIGREDDSQVSHVVGVICREALQGQELISEFAKQTLEALRKGLDAQLTKQINEVLHHETFQSLESTWRGLKHFVFNTETDPRMLKIRVLDVAKGELDKNFKQYEGVMLDQSPLFKKVYDQGLGILGGDPFGCLIGDFYFDHRPSDIRILSGMSKIAAASHCPFIAAADPSLLNMKSWQQIPDPAALAKTFTTPDYANWASLRESMDAYYVGLTMPRFLSRLPYGAKTEPVETFDFEETTVNEETGKDGDPTKYTWANASYAMAVNIADAFKRHGWSGSIRGVSSGGEFKGLLCHTFPTDDGGVDMTCPTEIAITHRREKELADLGFIPLTHRVNTDRAVFVGAQSLNRPLKYRTPEEQASAELSARLPYMFITCRIAHYLKFMCNDWVGRYTSKEALEKALNEWINQYVMKDIVGKTQEELSKRPLAEASIEVFDIPGNPGYYEATAQLRPHYQLEGISVKLTLVSKVVAK